MDTDYIGKHRDNSSGAWLTSIIRDAVVQHAKAAGIPQRKGKHTAKQVTA